MRIFVRIIQSNPLESEIKQSILKIVNKDIKAELVLTVKKIK